MAEKGVVSDRPGVLFAVARAAMWFLRPTWAKSTLFTALILPWFLRTPVDVWYGRLAWFTWPPFVIFLFVGGYTPLPSPVASWNLSDRQTFWMIMMPIVVVYVYLATCVVAAMANVILWAVSGGKRRNIR